MILILRGHIRDSFNNEQLRNVMNAIYQLDPDIEIYIYTWNIVANNISWRTREENHRAVTEEVIRTYFGEPLHTRIRHIIIDDDRHISLIGNVHGTIRGGPMPIVGWKNYWYGKYQIAKYLYHHHPHPSTTVINTRFDILQHLSHEQILEFISQHKEDRFMKNTFIYDAEVNSVDNLYMGNVKTMYLLALYFHYELDEILRIHCDTIHQERYVYRINHQLFSS